MTAAKPIIWRNSTSIGSAGGYLGVYTLYGNP